MRTGDLRAWLCGLALLWPSREPAPQEAPKPTPDPAPRSASAEEVRPLVDDVRAWIRDGILPSAEDILALRVESEALGPAARELVRELGRLGHRLGQAGRQEEGSGLITWAAEQAGILGDLSAQSWAYDWLGQHAWSLGRLEDAAFWIERAAEVDERRHAVEDHTRHLGDIASLHLIRGRFDDALEASVRAEEVARSGGSESARRMAAASRGSLLFELGRHREALALATGLAASSAAASSTIEPVPAGEVPRDETQVRLDILASDVLADVGRLESALAFARRALTVAREPGVVRVAPLLYLEAELSLGLLLGDLGRTNEALTVLDEAFDAFERMGDARGAAWAAKNRAFTLFAAGRQAESLPHFEHAWRAGRELGVPFLEGIGALGVAEAIVLGEPTPARDGRRTEEALLAAERIAEATHDRTLEWRCAALRGRILLEGGEYERALAALRHAIARIERWRRRLGLSGLVEHALRQRSDPYRDAVFAAAHLGRWEEALALAGLLQARVLDELRVRRDEPLPAPDTTAREALRERIVRLEHRARETEEPEAILAELEQAEAELDAQLLEAELLAGRTLDGLDEPVASASIGAALARQGFDVALVYLVGTTETLLVRIDAGSSHGLEGRLLPVGEARLAACIDRVRGPMSGLELGRIDLAHLAFDVRAARELHGELVAPLELPPGARVALVTDGILSAIPFELFVAGGEPGAFDFARPFAHLADLRFLGDDSTFVGFGSLARLARSVAPRTGPAVVFRAPDALGLPQAAEEVRGIARVLPSARIISDARPEDVRREASGAALVHFAAHGRIDPEQPAHGHLLLGGDLPGSRARLESWQVSELELDGALVVLSACHSGRGEWRVGEGLAGLTRGFFLAGAREVVASQWAVDDGITARFMELFYAQRALGRDTPKAAQAARMTLRRETDPRGFALAHPAFWAAWTVSR